MTAVGADHSQTELGPGSDLLVQNGQESRSPDCQCGQQRRDRWLSCLSQLFLRFITEDVQSPPFRMVLSTRPTKSIWPITNDQSEFKVISHFSQTAQSLSA
jgi:hypothetical protein